MPIITIQTNADALVNQGSPATNFGALGYLGIGLADGSLCRGWVRFDLSSIPAGSTINSATLKLFAFQGNNADGYSDLVLKVFRATNITWNESTITWNNADNASVSGSASATISTTVTNPSEFTADITSDVSSAFSSGKITVVLKGFVSGVETADGGELIQAKDFPGATYSKLVIDYTPSASVAPPSLIRRLTDIQLASIKTSKVISLTTAGYAFQINSGNRAFEATNLGTNTIFYGNSSSANNGIITSLGSHFWDDITDDFTMNFSINSAGVTNFFVIQEYAGN